MAERVAKAEEIAGREFDFSWATSALDKPQILPKRSSEQGFPP
jgi:hypothetical protein